MCSVLYRIQRYPPVFLKGCVSVLLYIYMYICTHLLHCPMNKAPFLQHDFSIWPQLCVLYIQSNAPVERKPGIAWKENTLEVTALEWATSGLAGDASARRFSASYSYLWALPLLILSAMLPQKLLNLPKTPEYTRICTIHFWNWTLPSFWSTHFLDLQFLLIVLKKSVD